VFAVYGETNRIKTKAEHGNGEDFLVTKIAQLRWLFEKVDSTQGSWDILIVDDGCPDGSGKVCKQVAEERGGGAPVEVIFLQDALDQGLEVTKGIASTKDSRKGGSIHYGLWAAAQKKYAGKTHSICYTDADLSTHMGQSGLLLDIIVNQGKIGAVGSRRAREAVMVKSGGRNTRGKLHAYLWKQMMPEMCYVVDTQTAFKAFKAEAVTEITKGLMERTMSFDLELLLKAQVQSGSKEPALGQAGICWKDSEAESTSGDASGYVVLLQQMAAIYRHYLPKDDWRESVAAFVDNLTGEAFDRLLLNTPAPIETRDAAQYKSPDQVSAAELVACCELLPEFLNSGVAVGVIEKVQDLATNDLDLTIPEYENQVRKAADLLIKEHGSRSALEAVREKMVCKKDEYKYFTHLVAALALSKVITQEIKAPFHWTVVFAVYGETNRIKTKAEHGNGEDFLVTKIAQLRWLFEKVDSTQGSWDILIVDDGCPDGSGKVCKQVAEERGGGAPVEVIFLQDALDQGLEVTKGIASTKDSRKGGSIHYGLWAAAQKKYAGKTHSICYTDADLSTHMGQSGLLLDIIVNQGKIGAVGSRRAREAVMVKSGGRNTRGKLHAYLWKQMMPEMCYVVDTQTAFKAFKAEAVTEITKGLMERTMSFDLELLLKAQVQSGSKEPALGQAGICWKDSEAESTSGDASGYVVLLQQMAAIYRHYLEKDAWRESIATFIDNLTGEAFDKLLLNTPAAIESRDAAQYISPDSVSAEELAKHCE